MEDNNLTIQQCNNRKSHKGYTLIELLIVIAVIGLLAGVLVTLINPATQLRKARDTQRKSDLSRMQSALEIFRADLGVYPCLGPGGGPGTYPDCALPGCGLPLTGGVPLNTYMSQIPCDPLSPPPTIYFYSTNATQATKYCIRACLENIGDSQSDEVIFGSNNPPDAVTGCAFSFPADFCTGDRRSYTVLSP